MKIELDISDKYKDKIIEVFRELTANKEDIKDDLSFIKDVLKKIIMYNILKYEQMKEADKAAKEAASKVRPISDLFL